MKAEDYEYQVPKDNYEISEKRKEELIEKINNQIRKGFIAHHKILEIGKNDEELYFLYLWLNDNNIKIRGINGTITGEIPNYTHIIKMGQKFTPEIIDEEEQEKLFLKLSEFSKEDKEKGVPEYLSIRARIIESYMPLARWVANWKLKSSLEREDREQMAYMGLIKAVDNYNPGIVKFSTYATKVISRKIMREMYIEDGELKPNNLVNKQIGMILEIEEEIFLRLGREAKPYEVADKLGISLKKLEELQTLIRLKEKESLEQVDTYIKDEEKFINGLLGSDKATKTSNQIFVQDGVYIDGKDILPQGFTIDDQVNDKVMSKMLSEEVRKSLLTLTEREAEVLRLRFGFAGDGTPMKLEEIGKEFRVCKETIRSIEIKALKKLRTLPRFESLKEFIEDDYEIE